MENALSKQLIIMTILSNLQVYTIPLILINEGAYLFYDSWK